MNSINVSTAKTSELVAFYNAHAVKPVNKFADRKTAERRVTELLATLKPAAKPAYVVGTCPNCGATTDITCGTVVESHGRQHVTNEHEALCHNCGHEFNYDTGRALKRRSAAANPDRSAAIAASWKNKDVAARRATRHAVRVTDPSNGQGNYKSVREAFLVLALPLGRHIKFRGALKAAGSAEIQGFKFAIVAE
jgi:transcription elongation factor Elf1